MYIYIIDLHVRQCLRNKNVVLIFGIEYHMHVHSLSQWPVTEAIIPLLKDMAWGCCCGFTSETIFTNFLLWYKISVLSLCKFSASELVTLQNAF